MSKSKKSITPDVNENELVGIYNNPRQVTPSGFVSIRNLIDNEASAEKISYPPAGNLVADTVKDALDELAVQQAILSFPSFKSFAIGDVGVGGSHVLAGILRAPAADTTLTVGGVETQVYGTAGDMTGAHLFIVPDGPASDACVLTVTGVSITDGAVRNDTDSEVLVADGTAMVANTYYQTTKKWLGQVTITITGTASAATNFNYGFIKYEDFGNRNYTLTDIEFTGLSGANETGFHLEVLHVNSSSFTYSADAFDPFANPFVSSANEYSATNNNFSTGNGFSYKRSGLTEEVDGANNEGVIVQITTQVNNSIQFATLQLGAIFRT